MPPRSAPTATTRAPYAESLVASSKACRLLPDPEIRTTRRAGAGSVTREPYLPAAGRPRDGSLRQLTKQHAHTGGTSVHSTHPTAVLRPSAGRVPRSPAAAAEH